MSKTAHLNEDNIISRIEQGEMLGHIAKAEGLSRKGLTDWIDSDANRSARAREARSKAAAAWDEMATAYILDAQDPFELAKAKELGHHLRWRASKIAPKIYGDKVTQEVTGAEGGPLQVVVQYVAPKKVEE